MPFTDARLSTIMEMLPKCRIVADIGCDHGRLGAQLLERGACERVWFSDISEDSLQKARALSARRDLSGRAAFFLGDGARALPGAPDAAVIAGMGGETIAGIIERAGTRFLNAYIVAQPNVDAPLLRLRAARAGYAIRDERIVRAGGRWYVLIAFSRGESAYTPRELAVGPALLQRKDEQLPAYAAFRLRVAQKALAGAKKSAAADTTALEEECAIWREWAQ